MTQEDPKQERGSASRRQVLVAGGAAVAVAGTGSVLASTALADEQQARPREATTGGGESCYRLSSEAIEGPYYIDADKIRTDVTEDREGVPLTLTVKVIDSETCEPVRNAAVDIWHCDALGVYSGYESVGSTLPGGPAPTGDPTGTPTDLPPGGGGGMHQEPTDDERYLRGTWRTDHRGTARFTTVFPGWYQGRAVHIHTKVHVDGAWTKDGYEGGHTCHTGQFYFEEEAVLAVAELEPYATSTVTRVTLTEDMIYDQSGATGGLLALRYHKKRVAKGVHASITVGVDPEATHDGDDAPMPGAPSPSASASASTSAAPSTPAS
ncbi:intradiol ring-cleavage dioxygenase [Streptomyces sp. CRN 30]|uniref:intradiol ring-cleavage dioxygenase n=1 Tax=Streptomyces sp. CRN 30 TaxID=3075613 RepID=UPI002A839E42|nr:intradiol ring-cleavage dioxygenase [Streptomyces sp. CRN 30]